MTKDRMPMVALIYPDGKPLLAGDLVEGATVEFDPFTGIIKRIHNPSTVEKKGRRRKIKRRITAQG